MNYQDTRLKDLAERQRRFTLATDEVYEATARWHEAKATLLRQIQAVRRGEPNRIGSARDLVTAAEMSLRTARAELQAAEFELGSDPRETYDDLIREQELAVRQVES